MNSRQAVLKVITLASSAFLMSGCMSVWSYKCTQEEIANRRIMASGNQKAMELRSQGIPATTALKAIPLNNNGFAIALDITALEALTEHPFRQIGAALLDAGAAYGIYRLGENQEWWGSKRDNSDNITENTSSSSSSSTTSTTSTDPSSSQDGVTTGRDGTQINIQGNNNTITISPTDNSQRENRETTTTP